MTWLTPDAIDAVYDEAIRAFVATGNGLDLDRATARARDLRMNAPLDPDLRGRIAFALSASLLLKVQSTGSDDLLDEAIDVARSAVADIPCSRATRLQLGAVLTSALCNRAGYVGHRDDLDEVLELTSALPSLGVDPTVGAALNNSRAGALLQVSLRDNDARSLREAIDVLESQRGRGTNAMVRALTASNLATALFIDFQRSALDSSFAYALTLAREAIELIAEAVPDWPQPHPNEVRIRSLRAGLLITRWTYHRDPADLDEAERLLDALLTELPPGYPGRDMAVMIAAAFMRETGEVREDIDGLDASIELFEEALEEVGESSIFHDVIIYGYALTLASRASLTEETDDLDEAVQVLNLAHQRGGEIDFSAAHQFAMAGLLLDRYLLTREGDEIDEVIASYEALLVDIRTTNRTDTDLGLIRAALARFIRYVDRGDESDLRVSLAQLQQAASLPSVTIRRIKAAQLLASLAARAQQWTVCADAAELALRSVESVLGALDLRRWDEWLHEVQGVAALGAYAAARLDELPRAIALLERGCGVISAARIAAQGVSLVEARKQGHGEIVDAYQAAADALRRQLSKPNSGPTDRITDVANLASDELLLADAIAVLHRARIRLLDVAPYLHASAELSELFGLVADSGLPLEYVTATDLGGARLVVSPAAAGRPPHLTVQWLPDLDRDVVLEMAGLLHGEDDDEPYTADPESDPWPVPPGSRGVTRGPDPDDADLVVNELRVRLALGTGTADALVVPVGLVGLLPLGSAWQADGALAAVSVAGSGLLHITARRNARMSQAAPHPPVLAAITNPSPCHREGKLMPSLFSADDEGAFLEQEYGALVRNGPRATAEELRRLLGDDSIGALHVAAHGTAEEDNPNVILLLLADGADGESETVTITDLPDRLRCGSIFLACCWIARSSFRLPDEAVGFPTWLLQAGVARVIAPLWPIDDYAGYQFVRAYYTRWLTDGMQPRTALARARADLYALAADPGRPGGDQQVLRSAAHAFVFVGS